MGPRLRGDNGENVAAHHILLPSGKRHRCPQMPSREWEFQGTSLSSIREGGGTPKGAPCNRPRLISRIAGKQRHTATPFSVPPRRLLRPWGLTSERRREQARHPGRFPHPSPAPAQPFKADPRSRVGRLPRAPGCAGHDPHARRRRIPPRATSVPATPLKRDEIPRNLV